MTYLLIFILGVAILTGALLLNVVAGSFGLMSWYDFLKNPGNAELASLLWLFMGYPAGLGILGYWSYRLLNL